MNRILIYLKKEKVMTIALALAVLSAFIIPPDKEYAGYIDLRVLGLLLCLMVVSRGFQEIGVFDLMAGKLLSKTGTARSLALVLVLLCFFSSMVITNDVALITFVPFAIMALKKCRREDMIIRVVVFQTIAANLGSMVTPFGNPQNLYLFSASEMTISSFFRTMLPAGGASLLLVLVSVMTLPSEPVKPEGLKSDMDPAPRDIASFSAMFILCLLVVFRVLSWVPVLLIIAALAVITGYGRLLARADYGLLLTFTGFFVFVGNMGRIPQISSAIASLMEGREILFSALSSQILSNVPAAILLSGFTERFDLLLVGTNVGGLGTLIASMASLISYKQYGALEDAERGKYLMTFSLWNFGALALLLGFCALWY